LAFDFGRRKSVSVLSFPNPGVVLPSKRLQEWGLMKIQDGDVRLDAQQGLNQAASRTLAPWEGSLIPRFLINDVPRFGTSIAAKVA
jgi:hypothetical protein